MTSVPPVADFAEANSPELDRPLPQPTPKSSIAGRLPMELQRYRNQADRAMQRLNKLLTTTAGLDSFLATLNYAFNLLAYLETRLPARNRLFDLLSLLLGRPVLNSTPTASSISPSSPTTASLLAAIISETRTTLRLTALLPLYTWLRSLLAPQPPTSDPTLHLISLTQCTTYIAYQALENLAHLNDHKIPLFPIPSRFLAGPASTRTWLLSNRLWFLGVTCDFFRLARQAQLERQREQDSSVGKKVPARTTVEQASVDRRWWNDLLVASCWWPLCLHWSLEEGLWGVNDGVIGLLGVVAGAETFRVMWRETATL